MAWRSLNNHKAFLVTTFTASKNQTSRLPQATMARHAKPIPNTPIYILLVLYLPMHTNGPSRPALQLKPLFVPGIIKALPVDSLALLFSMRVLIFVEQHSVLLEMCLTNGMKLFRRVVC